MSLYVFCKLIDVLEEVVFFKLKECRLCLSLRRNDNLKTTLLIICTLIVDSTSVRAEYFGELNTLTLQCLQFVDDRTCRKALIEIESLQRKAIAAKNYSCQTNALGLGADLIMHSLRLNREDSALSMLNGVNNICDGI